MFKIKKFFIIIFSLFMICCCNVNHSIQNTQKSFNLKEESMLETVKKSAVKIKTASHIILINKKTGAISPEEIMVHNGSGSIIKQIDDKTLILTAGHVCDASDVNDLILFKFPYFKKDTYNVFLYAKFLILDAENLPHPGIILSIDKKTDTCIIITTKINQNSLIISKTGPRLSERVYSVSYPKGIWWESNYNPILEGFYSGPLSTGGRIAESFSIRSTGGCSGGMIVNFEGELVGMIHSTYSEFDQITISASSKEINDILNIALIEYSLDPNKINNLVLTEKIKLEEALAK